MSPTDEIIERAKARIMASDEGELDRILHDVAAESREEERARLYAQLCKYRFDYVAELLRHM